MHDVSLTYGQNRGTQVLINVQYVEDFVNNPFRNADKFAWDPNIWWVFVILLISFSWKLRIHVYLFLPDERPAFIHFEKFPLKVVWR